MVHVIGLALGAAIVAAGSLTMAPIGYSILFPEGRDKRTADLANKTLKKTPSPSKPPSLVGRINGKSEGDTGITDKYL